jgi:hypothetical protein
MPWGFAAAGVASAAIGALTAPKAPSVPTQNYQAVADSSLAAAQLQSQTSREQLDWAKQQYAEQAPLTNAFMQSMIDNSNQQTTNAAKDRARYEGVFQPVEDQFVKTATGWNSPARATQEAGAAMADVGTAMEAARKTSTQALESFGVDPSQTRYAALDLSTRVAQASAQAAAGTQSRKNTEATALALQGEAINIGKGYPGQVAQSYAGATSAGSAGITSGLQTDSVYGNLMGTPTTWGALANQSNGAAATALNTGFGNEMSLYNAKSAASANQAKGIGQIIGGGYQAYTKGI